MDKAQRQLIDTYFRKRAIAAETEDDEYELTVYELIYLLENNKVGVNDLKDSEISIILIKRPDLFEKIASEKNINELKFRHIFEIMIARPELIDRFDFEKINNYHSFHSENGERLVKLLISHPELIDRFPTNIFSDSTVIELITNQPKFINRFINRFESEKWNVASIIKILRTFPELIDKFKYTYTYLSPREIFYFLYYKPELVEKFFKIYGKDRMEKIKTEGTSGLIYANSIITFPDLIKKHPELKPYFEN